MDPEKFKYKLFGRFKARKKSYLHLKDELEKNKFNFNAHINLGNYNILDVGSGSGENAIYLSITNPKSLVITCELFEDGNINLCNEIKKKDIQNIKLYQGNVLEFLDIIKKLQIFNEIWILFPDPWSKERHKKRRLISSQFLQLIHFFLKKDGKLLIATDSQSYIQSILTVIYKSRDLFVWQNQRFEEWIYANLDLPKTKFFQKAQKSNRKSIFFQLKRI